MALSINEANTISSKYFDKTLVQQCYDKSPMWVKMKKSNKIKKKGGNSIQYAIRYQRLDMAEAIDWDDQVNFEAKETRTGADQDWKVYRGKALIALEERRKNTGKPQIVSVLKDKATEMQDDIYYKFATDLYTDNPNGLGLDSLDTIVDSADTFAGIAVADASTWAAWEDASTTALALYGAGSLSYYCNQATLGDNMPTFHVTTRNVKSKFESIFEGQKWYSDDDLANAGFDNVKFKNAPVVGDFYCPASYWYGLDLNHFEFITHPDDDFSLTPWTDLFVAGYPGAMGRVIQWVGNLKCDLRRTSFKLSTINYTL